MKRYKYNYLLLIFVIAFFVSNASFTHAVTENTTGFISGQIWYSKESLVEGETVKIYTAIWNGATNSLSAHVEFYDNKTLLGARDVTILPSKIQDVSVSWKVTSGDHTISAKIISSTITNNGKKEQIVLGNTATKENRTFVPVSIKTIDGVQASSGDVVKNEIAKASSAVKDIVPDSVTGSISTSANSLDIFRDDTYKSILDSKNETQKEIDGMNNKNIVEPMKDKNGKIIPSKVESKKSKPLDATDKPIAYVKLFLLTIVGFIFGNTIVFYGLIALFVFFIIRFIYLKIKYR